ncbi:hypothetical protein [Thalassobacillus sp. B23F22_16]|uniref:hypothetical protein n=1 Tax=Thalassobacillus sp. B23F22_16 TaxID=3459513 RepID=UPI00373F8973
MKLARKLFMVLTVILTSVAFTGNVSAAKTGGTEAYVPHEGGSCTYSYYWTESEVEYLFHQKSNYTEWTAWASLALGPAGWVATSLILGGTSLGSSNTADWINQAYYKDTGVRICHDGLEREDYYNAAYYTGLMRYFY